MQTVADFFGIAYLKEPWFIRILIVLVITITLHFVSRFVLRRLMRLTKMSRSYWDDVLAYGAMKPLPAAIWLIGLAYMVRVFAKANHLAETLDFVNDLRDVVLIACVGWFFWRVINEFSQQFLKHQIESEIEVDRTTVDALAKLGHLMVFVIMLITLLQTLGFSVSGLLAAGGIGGIAIGFAAKDILANFFGGLTIYLDRPFSVGEWIRSPDKDIEGTVEMISWRHTRIRRFNKNPIYVPNAIFTTIALENPSRMSNRRIKETIGIRYDDLDKMTPIVQDVKAMLQSHPDIDQTQTLIVNFDTFNASSLDFFIYTFTQTKVWEEYHMIKQDVLLKVADIIGKHGAEIAFPTRTLHISQAASNASQS